MTRLLIFLAIIIGIFLMVLIGAIWAVSVHQQPLLSFPSSAYKSDWKAYRNTEFGFSFKYPPNFQGTSNDSISMDLLPGQTWEDQAFTVSVGSTSTSGAFEVTAHYKNDKEIGSSSIDGYGDPPGFWSPPMSDLIHKIYALAGNNEPVGPLLTTDLASTSAYVFTVNRGIGWNGAGRLINEENLWIFLEHGNTVLEISLTNTPTFRNILQTFHYTPVSVNAGSTTPPYGPSYQPATP